MNLGGIVILGAVATAIAVPATSAYLEEKMKSYVEEGKKLFPGFDRGLDDEADAYRHAYVSVRFTQDFWSGLAKFLGDRVENS